MVIDCGFVLANRVRPGLSELRLTGIPAIRHKTAGNGFLPMHFTSLIRKPRCPTPTRKVTNGYVKSIEKKHETDYASCYLVDY